MQADLDAHIESCNRNRPHRGRGMEALTPYQVFTKGYVASFLHASWTDLGAGSPPSGPSDYLTVPARIMP